MTKKLKIVLTIAAIFLLALFCYFFSNIVGYVAIAAVLTLITQPLLQWLNQLKIKNFQLPNGVNAFLVILLILVVFSSCVLAFSPLIISQVNMISQIRFEDFSDKFRSGYSLLYQYVIDHHLEGFMSTAEHSVMEKLQHFISLEKFGNFFSRILSFTGTFAIGVFSVLFITFFLLKDRRTFSKILLQFLPKGNQQNIIHIFHKIKNLLTRYFIGILCEIIIMMTLETLGLYFLGVPNALLIGFLGGLFNVIPYLGPVIGGVVGIVLALIATVSGGIYTGLGWLILKVVGVFIVANLIDNIVLQPVIYSKSVKAHPLEIFVVIIMGGTAAGILGMIVAIPFYTIIRTSVLAFMRNKNLLEKYTGRVGEKEG